MSLPGDIRVVGERCVLRALRLEDSERAFALLHQQAAILDWLVWRGPRSLEDMRDHFCHWQAESDEGTTHHLAIALASDDQICGALTLRPSDLATRAELGYWIGREHWGQGLGREAVSMACRLAFETLGRESLRAYVFVGNLRSMRLLESLGFQRSAEPHPYTTPDGRRVEEWTYELERVSRADTEAAREG